MDTKQAIEEGHLDVNTAEVVEKMKELGPDQTLFMIEAEKGMKYSAKVRLGQNIGVGDEIFFNDEDVIKLEHLGRDRIDWIYPVK